MDTGGGGSLGRVNACVAAPLMYSDAKCVRAVAPVQWAFGGWLVVLVTGDGASRDRLTPTKHLRDESQHFPNHFNADSCLWNVCFHF